MAKEENVGTINESTQTQEEKTDESPQSENNELQSQQAPEPSSKEKVFISESELKALEEKVKQAPADKKDVYQQVADELKREIESARKEQLTQQEQEALKSDLESLKAELNTLREQAKQSQRRGVGAPSKSPFVKDKDGRTAIPRAELDRLTRETLFKH